MKNGVAYGNKNLSQICQFTAWLGLRWKTLVWETAILQEIVLLVCHWLIDLIFLVQKYLPSNKKKKKHLVLMYNHKFDEV